MKSKVIASHTSSQRDSWWWYLIQKDDGTLHVGHESDSQGERIEREVPLNDFVSEGAAAQAELQNLIDGMFDGA